MWVCLLLSQALFVLLLCKVNIFGALFLGKHLFHSVRASVTTPTLTGPPSFKDTTHHYFSTGVEEDKWNVKKKKVRSSCMCVHDFTILRSNNPFMHLPNKNTSFVMTYWFSSGVSWQSTLTSLLLSFLKDPQLSLCRHPSMCFATLKQPTSHASRALRSEELTGKSTLAQDCG